METPQGSVFCPLKNGTILRKAVGSSTQFADEGDPPHETEMEPTNLEFGTWNSLFSGVPWECFEVDIDDGI